MSQGPAVSAIIPVYNGERHVAEAIGSVLGQTVPPAEVIVVDDGSTDGTGAVLGRFGPAIRRIHQPNRGTAAALNAGVAAAAGDFLAFCSHDDLWVADRLERQLRALATEPALDAVFGHVREFLSPELTPADRVGMRAPLDRAPGWVMGAALVRRAALDRIGAFDATLPTGETMEWMWRARQAGLPMTMLPEVLLLRRLHAGNTTRGAGYKPGLVRALKTVIDRRRRGGPGDGAGRG